MNKRWRKIVTISCLLIISGLVATYYIHNKKHCATKTIARTPIMYGYDISHYNEIERWSEINADFIILKATEGSNIKDKRYNTYKQRCKKYGIKVGAYHFFTTSSSPESQFNNYYSVVGKNIDIAPIIDVEKFTKGHMISKTQLIKNVRKFADLCKQKYNKPPIIYCNEHWYKKYFKNGFDDCFIWNGNVYHNTTTRHDIKQTKIEFAKGFVGRVDYDVIYNIDVLF